MHTELGNQILQYMDSDTISSTIVVLIPDNPLSLRPAWNSLPSELCCFRCYHVTASLPHMHTRPFPYLFLTPSSVRLYTCKNDTPVSSGMMAALCCTWAALALACLLVTWCGHGRSWLTATLSCPIQTLHDLSIWHMKSNMETHAGLLLPGLAISLRGMAADSC